MAASQSLMRRLPGRIVERPGTAGESGPLSSPCRPGSSTSAGRRPRPTCVPTRRCAPSPPPSTCPSWGRTGCGRWRAVPRQGPLPGRRAVPAARRVPALPGPFFHEFVTDLPEPQKVLSALEARGILGAGRWRAAAVVRHGEAEPSRAGRGRPLSRRCWTDEADF